MTWSPCSDRRWREDAAPHIVQACRRTWHPTYQEALLDIVEFTVARVEAAVSPRSDCVIRFERVPLGSITGTNPQRVRKSAKGFPTLREYLEKNPERDSLPIVCVRMGERTSVWDGHHRLRTYQQAGRPDIPAIVAQIVPGSGQVRLER